MHRHSMKEAFLFIQVAGKAIPRYPSMVPPCKLIPPDNALRMAARIRAEAMAAAWHETGRLAWEPSHFLFARQPCR